VPAPNASAAHSSQRRIRRSAEAGDSDGGCRRADTDRFESSIGRAIELQRRHAIVVNDGVERIEHVEAQLNPPRVVETDIARDGKIEGFRAATRMD
jgi:hypothetical protein